MKKHFVIFIVLFTFLTKTIAFATPPDEGMWLPIFLKSLNEPDLKARGLKISVDDIYSVNKSSIKDAVVLFGGGCTGEIISNEGLLLTNHHCGYSYIQSHSTLEKDYLKNGFWAMKREEELPNPGLTVTFIIRIEDVTKEILAEAQTAKTEQERQQKVNAKIKEISKRATAGTHYEAQIKPYFYGNEYYMLITETFQDVRLVGAPPDAIGKFGGDTDNWMWPRHTGDFSLFRVYSDKNGKPAKYSKDNVPLKPRYFLPISLKGIKKGDFTMVMGFPGRTQEYITSYAVKLLLETSNPHKIRIRDKILRILENDMKESDKVRIQYAAKQASIANAWKKWIGESRGLRKANVIAKKQNLEAQFTTWVQADTTRQQKYGQVLPNLEKLYAQITDFSLLTDYFNEAVFGSEIMDIAYEVSKKINQNNLLDNKIKTEIKNTLAGIYKNYNTETDKKIFAACMRLYYQYIKPQYQNATFTMLVKNANQNFDKLAQEFFEKSALSSQEKAFAWIDSAKDIQTLENDIAIKLLRAFMESYQNDVAPEMTKFQQEVEQNQRLFVAGLREMQPNRKFYPDANLTLRLAFGQVDTYTPADGVMYDYFTTLDGVIEKSLQTEVEDYQIPNKLKELYEKKDYGIYGVDGKLPVCFIASNHTTGGNSGSPVMNAEGYLIGTNFDRNWEGTMSDIYYDASQVRNITLDIRYTLFIIDKFAGAGYLLKEMKIIR
ncbi:MAG: S46 family peptidase [Microscillaceae bacterium]|nr:S46 family peptidase [Microscillaceae bacterium]MDW8460809.1 S46 family peptidase [Cytophagales bacterium]